MPKNFKELLFFTALMCSMMVYITKTLVISRVLLFSETRLKARRGKKGAKVYNLFRASIAFFLAFFVT